jgi:hypothetical protein
MPCRVSYDVHEWIHEDPAVPARTPVNLPAGRTVQRLPVEQEDPVELYCSLSLGSGCFCRAYVGASECASPGAQEATMEHHTFVTSSLTKTFDVWNNG